MTSVSVDAPAKVNLFLEVLRRRPDGYHDISTVFQQVSLADRLTVSPSARPGLALECSDRSLPIDGRNLVLKAAGLFAEGHGGRLPAGLRFRLTKRVPVGAGLGGGSSDAAAALKALWRLAGGNPSAFPAARFKPLTRRLGADVTFFLEGGRAKAGGVGHDLKPLPSGRRPYWFVLVFPRVFTSTPWVYGKLRFPLTSRRRSLTLEKMLAAARPASEWAPLLFNRLEEVVLPRVPAVREARGALLRAGCRSALMSGSGSSVFGTVDSPSHGRRAMAALPRGGWDAWLVRSI